MELTNEFEVPVSIEEAWKVLTDLERIAPCLPGAQLKEIAGDEHRGTVRVKVGPITASYRGVASFTELDPASHRAVLRAVGRESRGQGNATAVVTATLSETPKGETKVSVVTELNITGKVAQFGRGVLSDVSTNLLQQFAANLESKVLAPADEGTGVESATPAEPTAGSPVAMADEASPDSPAHVRDEDSQAAGQSSPQVSEPAKKEGDDGAVRQIDSPPAEPVDLVELGGASLAKRLVPYASVAGAIFLLRIVVYALKRRRK
jgi:carbon monoxide dehydrogenase subunit G